MQLYMKVKAIILVVKIIYIIIIDMIIWLSDSDTNFVLPPAARNWDFR